MRAKREKNIGLPKNWPRVPKRIKKKYYDKASRYYESLPVADDLPVGEW